MKNLMITLSFTAALAACGSNGKQGAGTSESGVTGAGSTFVYPVLSAWAADYQEAGRRQRELSVDRFGRRYRAGQGRHGRFRRDRSAARHPTTSRRSSLAQFPIVIGGIVPVINISGLQPGKLQLTGPLLADIFAGKVKTWNDQAIAGAQPRRQPAGRQHRRRPPLGRLGHYLQLHPLPQPGQPDLEGRPGRRQVGQLADRRRRQGQ